MTGNKSIIILIREHLIVKYSSVRNKRVARLKHMTMFKLQGLPNNEKTNKKLFSDGI